MNRGRLPALIGLLGAEAQIIAHGPIDLACTNDPALAGDLCRDFVGKLPVWLDLETWPEFSPRRILTNRRISQGLANADLVTVPTRGLWEEVRQRNPRVYILTDPVIIQSDEKQDVLELLDPAIGFFDSTESNLDPQIIIEIALANRPWQIYIAGSVALNPALQEADRRVPNLHLLPEEGTGILSRFKVAVFPYSISRTKTYWLPQAVLQAWAVNTPTVCSPLPELNNHPDLTLFATMATGFTARIQEILAHPDQTAMQTAKAAAFIADEHSPQVCRKVLGEVLGPYLAADDATKSL